MINSDLQKSNIVKGFDPQANTGGAISGAIIDRIGYGEAEVAINFAVVTGSPSAATTAVVIQHGDAANLSDAATFVTAASALDISAAGIAVYPVDLSGAKRYIRVTSDATYTGGTTPGNVIGAVVALKSAKANPPVSSTVLR